MCSIFGSIVKLQLVIHDETKGSLSWHFFNTSQYIGSLSHETSLKAFLFLVIYASKKQQKKKRKP